MRAGDVSANRMTIDQNRPNVYLDHFGLREAPFGIAPDAGFFFAGASRGTTLDAILYALGHDVGIVKVTGALGSGKTLLCRMLMDRLPSHVAVINLANPSLVVHEQLGKLDNEARAAVVLLDEAHAMGATTLEEILTVFGLETKRNAPLQLVLFGEPLLNEILARPPMRALRERITHNFALAALQTGEVAEYLAHRMRSAGSRGQPAFTPAAAQHIAKASAGNMRCINVLADKSLRSACADKSRQILPRHVRAAIRDAAPPRRTLSPAWGLAAIACAFLMVWAGWAFWPSAVAARAITSARSPAVNAPPQLSAVPVAAATAGPKAPVPATGADARGALPSMARSPTEHLLGQETRARIESTRQWLSATGDDHWVIQLLTSDEQHGAIIETLVGRATALADSAQIHVYSAELKGRRRIGVIYGDYPSQEAATAGVRSLPDSLRQFRPYPRQVAKLR